MKVYQEEKGRERMMVKKYTVGYQMGIFVANLIFDDKKNPKSFFVLNLFSKVLLQYFISFPCTFPICSFSFSIEAIIISNPLKND